MAFLDNSGDIILDAVLTDLGRKRMAEGNFRITQFALGDDEIDYRVYNKNHPSGSAYYDLEILQTPVLEAFASSNSNINFGLASYNGNLNLLYLPTIKIWNKTSVGNAGANVQRSSGSVYYLAADAGTGDALLSAFTSNTDIGDAASQYYQAATGDDTVVLLETGIHSPSSPGNPPKALNADNRDFYIAAKGLEDITFDVSVDERFISQVKHTARASSKWVVNDSDDPDANLATPLMPVTPGGGAGGTIGINKYKTANCGAFATSIASTPEHPSRATSYSTINGPSGMMIGLKFTPAGEMDSQTKYALHGRTGQDLFGDGNTYDYIDTKVYVVGKTTGVTAHVPIRVVRKVTS